ncbi:hypothetical protein QWZ13_13100 [Reinekea marina]|uniref:hypothetical protein n=1 Tax=Reinekea marina TaxID=1310421 RepID=UPI0025B549DE|nr:hypothetical protein [Reinekea marina]MDN3649850.1 hypothetical protein [Reinekea marina]
MFSSIYLRIFAISSLLFIYSLYNLSNITQSTAANDSEYSAVGTMHQCLVTSSGLLLLTITCQRA